FSKVTQWTLRRPNTMTTQYLQQLHAAQQQQVLTLTAPSQRNHQQTEPVFLTSAAQPNRTVMSSAFSHSALFQNIKPSLRGQTLQTPPPKMSICPLKSTKMNLNLGKSSRSESLLITVTHPSSAQTTMPFTSDQTHSLVPQNPDCSSAPWASQQLITLEGPSLTTCTQLLSVSSSTKSNQPANQSTCQIVPRAALPNPPPLYLGQVLEPVSQHTPLSCPPPLTLALPKLMKTSVRSGQTVLGSKEEVPVTKKEARVAFKTVAVDLKVTSLVKESKPMGNDLVHVFQERSRPPTPSSDDQQPRSSDDTAHPENRDEPDQPPMLQHSKPFSKPHILTHLIEGFVIHEGLEPFSVRKASLKMNLEATLGEDGDEKSDRVDRTHSNDFSDSETKNEHRDVKMSGGHRCEFCGNRGLSHAFIQSKHFCSMMCIKSYRYKNKKRSRNLLRAKKEFRSPPKPIGKQRRPYRCVYSCESEHHPKTNQDTQCASDMMPSSTWKEREQLESDPPPATLTTQKADEEDHKIRSHAPHLSSCGDVAQQFVSQEIDGQALLLLTEEHLRSTMNIKLGPALKICANICALKKQC
ncbi:hypothetical protein DNTS_028542, partial [Danionella cerebrum]